MNSALKIDTLNNSNINENNLFNHYDARYKPSSVFILIFESKSNSEVLFLKRSDNLEFHKGEVCFPGGSYEKNDKDLLATAYREVKEETGIKKDEIKLLAFLDQEITRTGFTIRPFIGLIKKEVKIIVDNKEIEAYFKLSINELRNNKNKRNYYHVVNNNLIKRNAYFCKNKLIWGATANILTQALEVI